jgi:hypothetical protein
MAFGRVGRKRKRRKIRQKAEIEGLKPSENDKVSSTRQISPMDFNSTATHTIKPDKGTKTENDNNK